MSDYYTKAQIDGMGTVVGQRIKTATDAATIATAIDALPDTNLLTDAERTKLAGLESSKFKGTFTSVGAIPTVGAAAGDYADVDSGGGEDTQRYIYDVDQAAFVLAASTPAGETAASIKTKYESNANTNAFTDAEKSKLAAFVAASGITDFTAALDAALA